MKTKPNSKSSSQKKSGSKSKAEPQKVDRKKYTKPQLKKLEKLGVQVWGAMQTNSYTGGA